MTHTIAVLLPRSVVLTDNQRGGGWQRRAQRVIAIRSLFAAKARAALKVGPPIPTPTRCVAWLGFPDPGRLRDPNNWAPTTKACVDACVAEGLLAADDFRHLTGPDHRIDPNPSERGFVRVTLVFGAPDE